MINIWTTHTQQNPEDYAPVALPFVAGNVSDVIYCPFCRDLYVRVDVTGLTGSQSVTGRVQGSVDGVGWDNIAADGNDTVITENSSTLFSLTGALPPYIRVTGFTVANTAIKFTIPIMV